MNLKMGKIVFFLALFIILFCPPTHADWAFVILGDTREDFKRGQVFPEMIKELNQTVFKVKDQELKLEFLLHLGDFELKRGSRESLERFKERLKALKARYYLVKGNHELVEQTGSSFTLPSIQQVLKNNEDFSREYISFFDLKESYYSFDHRNLHVIILDNSMGTFQVKPGEDIRSGQLLWLEKDLEETARKAQTGLIRHTILCAHIPLPSPSPSVTTHDMLEYVTRNYAEGQSLAEESAKIFWEILERYRERSRIGRLFFAHDHRYVSYQQKGFPVTITAGGGAPLIVEERGGFYHYLIILVTDEELKERIIKAYPLKKAPAGGSSRSFPHMGKPEERFRVPVPLTFPDGLGHFASGTKGITLE
jgi:3',5'-cyclic AMP phosphodiesterase CpdA